MEYLGILPSSPRRSKESTSMKQQQQQRRSSSNINRDNLRTNHGSTGRPGSSVQLELSHQLPPTHPFARPLPVSSSSTHKVIRARSGRTLGVGSTTSTSSGGGRHVQVKVNMDSSLALSSSLNNPASDFSLSSVASPDSFVLALDNFSSDEDDIDNDADDDNHLLSGNNRNNNYSWSKEQRSSAVSTSSSARKVFLGDSYGESHSDFDPYLGNIRLKLPLQQQQQQHKPQKESQQPIPPRPPPQSPSSVTRHRLHNPARHSSVTTCRNNTDVILQQRLPPQSFYRTTNANRPEAECGSNSTSPETASPPSSITGDVTGTGAVATATPEADSTTSWTLSLPSTLQLSQIITSLPRIRVSVASTNHSHHESKSSRIPPPSQATYLPFPTSVTAPPPSTPTTSTLRTPPAPLVATPEQVYWNRIVARRTTQNLPDRTTRKSRAAEAFYHLGNAHMRAKDYAQAWTAFQSAKGIWKSLHGPNHLSVAQASDAMGMAMLRSSKTRPDLQLAKKALDMAFTIRYNVLGPWHVDTVDSYNKIAGVHLHLLEYPEARACYEQVFLVRRAIFGPSHPSVAISAHSLANVHFHLSPMEESLRYYNIALDIYLHRMQLKSDHPTVARVLRDRKRLERVRMAEQCVQLVSAEGVEATTHKNHGGPQQPPFQKQHSLLDEEMEEDAYEIDEYTLSGGGGGGLNESENHSISMLTTSTMFRDGMKVCSAPAGPVCLETACRGRKVLL
jgi:tetratricopeptide (TPR) repeat protein